MLFFLHLRLIIIVGLAVAAVVTLLVMPPFVQDVHYHQFADQRTLLGVPNFWNVASNLPFLLVALWGLRAVRSPAAFLERWERTAYCCILTGLALVAFGSGYYHLRPDNATLFWDRLPMTIVFTALLAATIGERIGMRTGRLLLLPLLALGAASVMYWKITDDLRPYIAVQFYPMLALPLMLILFPPRYSGTAGIFTMIGLYALAKVFEFFDYRIAAILPTGGHPWKHVAGAIAMLCYVNTVAQRQPIRLPNILERD